MKVSVGWPDRCMAWMGDRLSSPTPRQRAFITLATSPVLFAVYLMAGLAWGLGSCMAWMLGKLTSRRRAVIALALSPLLFALHLVIGLAWGLGWGFVNATNEVHQSWRTIRGWND